MENLENCGVPYALKLLNGKWKIKVIWLLMRNPNIRFNELQRQAGEVSAIMLSKTLQELETAGIVYRQAYDELPLRVEYSLTELGHQMKPFLAALDDWGKLTMDER